MLQIISFFKQNASINMLANGFNPVTETITEFQTIGTASVYFEMLNKFKIGSDQRELFALAPNSVNSLILEMNTFTE